MTTPALTAEAIAELRGLAQEGIAYIGRRERRGRESPKLLALLSAATRALELERFLEEYGEAVEEEIPVEWTEVRRAFRALRGMR